MLINEDNYVDVAEKAILKLKDKKGLDIVTTSKIRNLLAMVSDIYNDVVKSTRDELSPKIIEKINYMKIRFYYEAGREESVRRLIETADVFENINQIGKSKRKYILFSRYMEALVAFRKYHCGKDE